MSLYFASVLVTAFKLLNFLILLLIIFRCCHFLAVPQAATKFICEGNTRDISCPGGNVISVNEAFYGRIHNNK